MTSFTEGNSLNTLEITTNKTIELLDNDVDMKSKIMNENEITYLLASNDFLKLKKLINQLEQKEKNFKYQLKSS